MTGFVVGTVRLEGFPHRCIRLRSLRVRFVRLLPASASCTLGPVRLLMRLRCAAPSGSGLRPTGLICWWDGPQVASRWRAGQPGVRLGRPSVRSAPHLVSLSTLTGQACRFVGLTDPRLDLCCKGAQGRTRARKAAQGRTRPHKAAQGCPRSQEAARGRTRPHKGAQVCARPHRGAQGRERVLQEGAQGHTNSKNT